MRPLVILGAGGFGAEVAALVEDINRAAPTWDLSGFLDDDPSLHGTRVLGYPVLGDSSWLTRRNDHAYVIGIGGSEARSHVASRITQHPVEPAVLVHPTAHIHESSRIGVGGIICRGSTVTVRARIGRHVIANLHVTVGHDANLGDFTTLHPAVNLSGNSSTGACVEIGTGAILLPGTEVGRGSVIGAGAVVTRNIPPDSVAVGVPATVTRSISEAVAN